MIQTNMAMTSISQMSMSVRMAVMSVMRMLYVPTLQAVMRVPVPLVSLEMDLHAHQLNLPFLVVSITFLSYVQCLGVLNDYVH